MHTYFTSIIDALLRSFGSSMEYSLRMIVLCWSFYGNDDFEVACSWNLAYRAICRYSMLILNSRVYNQSDGLLSNGCIVQMMPSLLLIGLTRGMCSSTSSPERLIGNSLIFLRLQSMYSFKCLSILTVTKIGDCDL